MARGGWELYNTTKIENVYEDDVLSPLSTVHDSLDDDDEEDEDGNGNGMEKSEVEMKVVRSRSSSSGNERNAENIVIV